MTPEEPVTSASGAGLAEEARPAPAEPPIEPEGASERVVAYLLDAPAELEDWASAKLSEIDPDGRIAERAAAAPDPSPAAAPAAAASEKARSPFPWKGILIGAVAVGIFLGVYYAGLPQNEAADSGAAMPVPTMPAEVPVFEIDAAREAELQEAIEADPADTGSMRELADLYMAAGDWPKATTWLIRVVELDPDDIDSRLKLGVTHLNVGNVAQAEAQWREVTERDPMSEEAYFNLAFAHLSREPAETAEAIEDFETAVEIDPDFADAHYNLGFLHLAQDPPRTEDAIAAWNRVIEIAPDSPIAETARTHIAELSRDG